MKYENRKIANDICDNIKSYSDQLKSLESEYVNVAIYSNDYLHSNSLVFQTGENLEVYKQELTPLTNEYIDKVKIFIMDKIECLKIELESL